MRPPKLAPLVLVRKSVRIYPRSALVKGFDRVINRMHIISLLQGFYRSWKTWKVIEFKHFTFQTWKVMELEEHKCV